MLPSDRELMQRLAAGDREALSPLMERHSRRVYRIALSYLRDADDALDAVQDTFVKAFQNAARCPEMGPGVADVLDLDQAARAQCTGGEDGEKGSGAHPDDLREP